MKRLKSFLEENIKFILSSLVVIYIIFFSLICLWKYYNFHYDLLDLAIINQVFFNSAHGNWFASSIHPPSYLGDHFTPILILLLPFYLIYKSPLTLLLLQTIILALAAWPLFLTAKNILGKLWGLFFALAFLLNPLVANINLFEFHFLPLAIFFLLFAIYFYQKKDLAKFLIFILLSLLVREDVSLVVFMFGILAILDRRKLKWILTPMILAALYFILSLKIINLFWPAGDYKFMIYYSWLGSSWPELIKNIFLKIDKVFFHLLKIGNLEMVLGLLLPFIFLPLLAPKFLILTLLIFVQFILGEPGGSNVILETHYSSLFIPALFMATILAVKKFKTVRFKFKFLKFLQDEKGLALVILGTAVIYSSVTMGPLLGTAKEIYQGSLISNNSKTKMEMIKKIPAQASVVASYDFLTALSSREDIYSFHYAYLGHQQFNQDKYQINKPVDILIIDLRHLTTVYLQYQDKLAEEELLKPDNLLNLIEKNNLGLVEIKDGFALYQTNKDDKYQLYQLHQEMPPIDNEEYINLDQTIEFLGYNFLPQKGLSFFWQAQKNLSQDYFLKITIKEGDKTVSEDIFPMAYALLPSNQWQKNQIIQTNYWLAGFKKASNKTMALEVIQIQGGLTLTSWRSGKNLIEETPLGQPIKIQLAKNPKP